LNLRSRSAPSHPTKSGLSRLGLAALGAALAVAALAGLARPAQAAVQVGLMDPAYAHAEPEAYWKHVEALRPAFVRYDLHWNEIAPAKPKNQRDPSDPAYRWGYFDDLMRDAGAHGYEGCEIVTTIWRTPGWASSIPGKNYANMPRVQQFRNFMFAAATRYSGSYDPDGAGPLTTLPQVSCWEIWNEPNFNGALRPQRKGRILLSAINYTKLLNAAYAEIKRVGRTENVQFNVIGGALYRQRSTKGVGPVAFMQEMRRRNARFDVLSIHPYNGVPRLGIRDGAGVGTVWPNIAIGNFHRFQNEVNRLWRGQRFPIWITEYGWQTKTGKRDQYAVTEQQQATFLRQSISIFRRQFPRVGRISWFLIKDEPATSTDGRQNTWQSGFLRLNGTKKPAYRAWQQLTGVAKKARPAG
jgi:hypothetical protein